MSYETQGGAPLTTEEAKLVRSLEKLAKQWEKHGQDLWLYSGDGSLYVMMRGELSRNPHPEASDSDGVNPVNVVTIIPGIANGGGGW